MSNFFMMMCIAMLAGATLVFTQRDSSKMLTGLGAVLIGIGMIGILFSTFV